MSFVYEPLPGGEYLEKQMTSIATRSADLFPAYRAIITDMRRITASNFAANGPGWPPLADSTVRTRVLHGSDPSKILRDTGVMFDSLMGSGPGAVEVLTTWGFLWGTDVAYAHWHQTGGFRRHASGAEWPPKREFVRFTEAHVVEFAAILAGWLLGGIILEGLV